MISTIYRSKIDFRLILFLVLILGICAAIMIYQQVWVGLGIILFVAAFVAYNFVSIRYIIDPKNLTVITGIAPRQVIPIDKIWKISLSSNIVSSPATSLSRIGIHYNHPAPLLLSPKRRELFIAQLKTINPKIEISE